MTRNELVLAFQRRGCLPHQADFAAAFYSPESPARHLLVSDPGLGKGFLAAAVVAHTLQSGSARRVLVLAPSALLPQWGQMIQRAESDAQVIVVDRRQLREFEALRPSDKDVWPERVAVLMSADFAKQVDVAERVVATTWDLVVVDEVQLATSGTLRHGLLAELFRRSPQMRALLLRVGNMVPDPAHDVLDTLVPDVEVTRWSRHDVRDQDGTPLLPEVHVQWVAHHRNPDEREVLIRLEKLLHELREGTPQTRFAAMTLLQAASSSLFTLEQRLCRLRQRRNEAVHALTAISELQPDLEEFEPTAVPQTESGEHLGVLPELSRLPEILLPSLEQVSTDSKLDALLNLLVTLGVGAGSDRRVCVLTKFVDTATYLEAALGERFTSVNVLTGRLAPSEREHVLDKFDRNGGVLVATVATETNLPEVAAVVFYDLPLNPVAMEAQIGRFVRIGRRSPVRVFAFRDETETMAFERLQGRLAEVKQALGLDEMQRVLFSPDQP